jgi:hypothetical protein
MGENYRKNVDKYTQWCDPKRKGPKQRVYRPHSMRMVDACAELNRLQAHIDRLERINAGLADDNSRLVEKIGKLEK